MSESEDSRLYIMRLDVLKADSKVWDDSSL